MKILNTSQIREADAYTIKHEPVKSIDLMERAAARCFDWIFERAPELFPPHLSGESEWVFQVVCGMGNNGGDGLAIARMLMRNGYTVELFILDLGGKGSDDFQSNLGKLGAAAKKQITYIKATDGLPQFNADAVIIDAIFGSGLNRKAEGVPAALIAGINASGAHVVSIDLPSGLPADGDFALAHDDAVKAHNILSFQTPKLAFFLAEYAPFVGEVHLLDIQLHQGFIDQLQTEFHLITTPEAALLRKPRPRFAHKGSFGEALLIGGSRGMWGALVLAAGGCLRAGAGKVRVHCPEQAFHLTITSLPEVMHSPEASDAHFTEVPDISPYSALGVGPGLGTHPDTVRALKLLIQECRCPLVLDADALNILAENRTWLAFLPKGSILTPHPGEWARLTGETMTHLEGLEMQRAWSLKYGIYIVLKGANSSLSTPDGKVWINTTGNPGMATAGSGDVLTGILTGLLAQGYSAFEAAALGMHLHGLAGDLALVNGAQESILASDLMHHLGKAFQQLTYATK